MKDVLGKYFEVTGANRSYGNDKETILLGRRIAAQRIVIDVIHLFNKCCIRLILEWTPLQIVMR